MCDECNPGQHRTLQHLISSIIAIICRGMYGLRGWILRSTLAMLKPATGRSYKGYYGELLTLLSWFESMPSRQIKRPAQAGFFLSDPP